MEIMEIEVECISYLNMVEKISPGDRECVRSQLALLAEWIREQYPFMNYTVLRKFLCDMISVSI